MGQGYTYDLFNSIINKRNLLRQITQENFISMTQCFENETEGYVILVIHPLHQI